jgi:hypothetical protein
VPGDKADDYLLNMIRSYISQCLEMCSPTAAYSLFPDPQFVGESSELIIEGKHFHLHKMVYAALKKSDSIILFIGSCGSKVELFSKQLIKEGNSLEGFIVDLIGSEIAEGIAELTHNKIEADMAALDLRITNRYSPGYCNWPVSDQQQLFFLLGNNNCGVKLTESSLMLPIKSVSGVIGAGKQVKNRGYACTMCEVDHCIYRVRK